jgi:hypothetical protein
MNVALDSFSLQTFLHTVANPLAYVLGNSQLLTPYCQLHTLPVSSVYYAYIP